MGGHATVSPSAAYQPDAGQADAGPRAAEELPRAAEELPRAADELPLATDELLVEEVSIDGMCGVY